jgi:hypothetical protein
MYAVPGTCMLKSRIGTYTESDKCTWCLYIQILYRRAVVLNQMYTLLPAQTDCISLAPQARCARLVYSLGQYICYANTPREGSKSIQ